MFGVADYHHARGALITTLSSKTFLECPDEKATEPFKIYNFSRARTSLRRQICLDNEKLVQKHGDVRDGVADEHYGSVLKNT